MKFFQKIAVTIAIIFALISAGLFSPAVLAQSLKYQPQDAAILSTCVTDAVENGLGVLSCAGTAAIACFREPNGFTTLGTTQCNMRENSWWDEQLNLSYQELKSRFDVELFAALRQTQRNWIAYRDAKCEFRNKVFADGSIRQILYSGCMLQTTSSRTADLMEILGWTN